MGNFLDFVEDAVTTVERISDVARRPPRPARLPRRPVASTASNPPQIMANPTRAEFSIVDSIDAETGEPAYVVRNQRGDTATCSSAAFARRVRDALG